MKDLLKVVAGVLVGMGLSKLRAKEIAIDERLNEMNSKADPTIADELEVRSLDDIVRIVGSLKYVSNDFFDVVKDPRQMIIDGGGDCEDFAVLTYSLLLKLHSEGLLPKPHLAVAYCDTKSEAHAFTYFYDGKYHIFSNEQYLIRDSLKEFLSEIGDEHVRVL